jgi:hypothetical protein
VVNAVLLLVSTALAVLAVIVVATPVDDVVPDRSTGVDTRAVRSRAAGAVLAGSAVLLVSGWVLPGLVVAVGTWWAVATWQGRDRRDRAEVERIEALATWIEHLRDVLVAGDQPIGAIGSTVATCPAVIRGPVRRLAAGLGRQDPDLVFRRFADELDDPTGDLVAAGLSIAVRRGARTVAVLTALAEQARHQADRRRLVEAERAPTRREVGLLTGIMGLLLGALLLFGRSDYLAAYDTAAGQLFLAVALALYAALLVRVQHLARFPRPARFLGGVGTSTTGAVR